MHYWPCLGGQGYQGNDITSSAEQHEAQIK
jgi:hypothetical protein